ncbi:MAG: PIN domain-containing protein [Nanoarchaeota archaeon]|nr:hypothetical protein [Nanoarchaeota archaeon]
MKLVVDTNVLFSFFWKNSISKKLLMNTSIELFSPEFALEEINKYEEEIIIKTKITKEEFKNLKKELAIIINFVPLEEYKDFFKQAVNICPDTDDADFFALALKFRVHLWSNDSKLKDQEVIKIMTTKDLLNNPDFVDSIFD